MLTHGKIPTTPSPPTPRYRPDFTPKDPEYVRETWKELEYIERRRKEGK